VNQLAEGIISFVFGHPRADLIPGDRSGNHDNPMVGPSDALGTVGEGFDL
jgi:hypothetical protein